MSETNTAKLSRADEKLWGYMAEFDSPGALKKAAHKVRKAGFTKWDCYSPFPVHGLDPAMGIKMTILPLIVFGVGALGTFAGLALQTWANAIDWPWIVSGKPFFSLPAQLPIIFELTILFAALTAFFGMWTLNRLPQVWHPLFRKDSFLRVTQNGFFMALEAADEKFERSKTHELLEAAGASNVNEVHASAEPGRRKMPRMVLGFIIMSSALALVPFAFLAKARASRSREPRYHLIPNMDFSFAAAAQQKSEFFTDGRVQRSWVKGTVARGYLENDDAFFHGIEGGQWVPEFPERRGAQNFVLNKDTMERGRLRYNIYCAPCHGYSGKGNGVVHARGEKIGGGWVQPSNIAGDATIIRQPHGQIFNTISNGIRNMQGYSAQIPPADRWAIVLYLRAMQRAQNARSNDMRPSERSNMRPQ